MTLPVGTISLSDVNVELSKSATATISLNDADVRGLAAVPSGLIDLQDLQGKSAVFVYTITTNQTDLNLRTLALANGWNGIFPAQITVGSGVSINGSVAANSTPALTIDGSWPNGVTLINNGSILGRGGNGGNGSNGVGTAGGRALTASVACSINNIGTIAGGGGGGGGGRGGGVSIQCDMDTTSCNTTAPGGGGGGGRSSVGFNASGGSGGGTGTCNGSASGSAAGAGQAGTSTAPGNGGGGASIGSCSCINCSFGSGGAGGAGGAYGTAGTVGGLSGGAGGAAGQAVNGNANITWVAFGTRLGTIV